MNHFSSSQEGQQDGVERTIQTPNPFDWATASAEDKVRRTWPRIVVHGPSGDGCHCTSDGDFIAYGNIPENMWKVAAGMRTVLALQRRETSLPISPALVAAYVAAEGDLGVAEEVVAACNKVAAEELPALDDHQCEAYLAAQKEWIKIHPVPERWDPSAIREIRNRIIRERQLRTALAELSEERKENEDLTNAAVAADQARMKAEAELSALKESAGARYEVKLSELDEHKRASQSALVEGLHAQGSVAEAEANFYPRCPAEVRGEVKRQYVFRCGGGGLAGIPSCGLEIVLPMGLASDALDRCPRCNESIVIVRTEWVALPPILHLNNGFDSLAISASAGARFEEAWAKQQEFMDSAVYSTSDETREKYVRHIANAMWSAGLASLIPKVKAIRREALQDYESTIRNAWAVCYGVQNESTLAMKSAKELKDILAKIEAPGEMEP